MREAISYIRVSNEEQADSGLGLEAQRRRIAAYCQMKGLRLVEVFEDPGVSGGKPLAGRPAGSRLLAAARKSKAVVVMAKLDRCFRSVADAANVIADFDKRGIQLPKKRLALHLRVSHTHTYIQPTNGLHCTCEFYTHPHARCRTPSLLVTLIRLPIRD